MPIFDEGLFRPLPGTAGDTHDLDPREIPQEVSRDVIKNAVQQSAILRLANVRRMPSRSYRMPALALKPDAYWLTGSTQTEKDSALKQTTHAEWKNIVMQAEEMAVMVPVPDSYVDDVGVDLLAEIVPEIGEAFARKLDGATLFGIDTPFGTGDGKNIYARAVAAGNTATFGTGDDTAQDIAGLARQLTQQGYAPAGFAVEPGFSWRLSAERTTTGVSPYAPSNGVDGVPDRLFGRSMYEVLDGAWDSTRANLIVGDWSKAIVGIRQDMTVRVMDGVISDENGVVIYNSVQQDGKILRVVMRVAFCTVAPLTALSSTGYPFAVLRTSGGPSS
jgi:HK97 family phage major capsid protein